MVLFLLVRGHEICDRTSDQKGMVPTRRSGYSDTKEHYVEGLPDVRYVKSVRRNKNLLRHGKICCDIHFLNKFYLVAKVGEKVIFDKFSSKKS